MNDSVEIYAELLSAIVRLNSFSTIVYLDPEDGKERCHLENWLSVLGKGIPLLWWRSIDELKLSSFINAQLLVVACLPGVYRLDLLNTISSTLRYMRQTKLLIELITNQDVPLVRRVLEFCLQNQMLNAALISGSFGETHTLYIYDAYPSFLLKRKQFTQELFNLYPDKMLDLHGYRIRTMPDLSEPNTILYRDKEGKPRLLGYVWNMLEEFARKHNAGLQLIDVVREGKFLSHIQVLDLARDNLVDIAASVQPLTLRHLDRYHEYAYPAYMASWCTMLPMEPLLGVREIYTWMLPAATLCFLAVLWALHELLLGRYHRHRRLLGIGWKLLAIMLACNVQGRLVTLLVAPPGKPSIHSFDALSNSHVRIFGMRFEHNLYDFDLRTRYAQAFYLSDKVAELLWLRNSLNTSYAYTVTHTKWQLYAEQQAYSSRPLFYYSKNFCFYQYVPFALVIPENSPHRATLHHFLLQLSQSGLYMHWVARSFYYMVQAGKLQIRDLGEARHVRSLVTEDLHDVLQGYVVGVLISLTLFACELFISRARHWLDI
ncbi:uncharacterized protein LOC115771965 [Drosophila novamexicana]|uniref:uncharacterized protein LOC115771965 n=1 Tax=Drosophila novamexicana TaxID=47314 RepID=UPI0011E5A5F4|nr:uncharacterized protein LOC115771965 [Drosophila novamexicana]